jgi:hypothetical protein
MEKTETRNKEPRERELKEIMGGAMIPVQVELFEPFVKFAKEYIAFFGSKDTLEIFLMKLIYHEINRLHSDLTSYVYDNEKQGHILAGEDWFDKHPHLAASGCEDEDKDC